MGFRSALHRFFSPTYTLTDPAGTQLEISSESAEAVRFVSQSVTVDGDAEYCVMDGSGTYKLAQRAAAGGA